VISCKEAVARLWEYLDKNLAHLEERELDEHLGVCRHCCGELEFVHRLQDMLRQPSGTAALTTDARTRLEVFLKELGGAR
jgi:DNA-directed RNA polymerase subunit N (RpoN/RPB10)